MALIRTFTFYANISFGLLIYCFIFASTAFARTWHVRSDGTGEAPFIQAAIDSAGNGDEILVGPGAYFENIDFLGKAIILRGEMGSAATILDGSGHDSSTVVIRRGEPAETILEGFTITGGRGSPHPGPAACAGRDVGGGGLWCAGSPIVRNNTFSRNRAYNGGAVLIRSGNPMIEKNTFEFNDAESGGAISIDGETSRPIIRGNMFHGNTGYDCGGCIGVVLAEGEVVIENNEFIENGFGSSAAAVDASIQFGSTGYPTILLNNNLFSHNHSCNGINVSLWHVSGSVAHNTFFGAFCSGVLGCKGCAGGVLSFYQLNAEFNLSENMFADNAARGVYCDGSLAGFGTNLFWSNAVGDFGPDCPASLSAAAIVADPLFCDPAGGDFHVAANSPAIVDGVVLGYYPTPGCPAVPVIPLTWGRLKSLYH